MDNVGAMVSEDMVVMPLSIDLEIFDLDEALAVVGESRCLFGAWKTFVSNLPAVVEVAEDDICSVCMEGFDRHNKSGEGNKRVPCGHVYHSNCITMWLQRCNSCPLCRRHISLHF
ncbi:Zinc finger, RING-type [Sesbania bispinosa]|nr:Zinc finger, RING-type [Sesbania bispinosa]